MAGLSRVAAVAANTFRETVRERVLYNLVFFAILMTLGGLLLGPLSIRQDERILKDVAMAAMDGFGTLIALFIGVGLVAKEIERRSLYPLLAKPLSRDEFLLGKFAGLCLTLFVNVAVMAAGLCATLLATGRRPDAALLAAAWGILLGLVIVVAIALLFSTMTSSALAAICTLGVVVAGRYSDLLRNSSEVMPEVPTWLTSTVALALPNFANLDLKGRVVHGDPVAASELTLMTAYAVVYATLVLGFAVAAFRRRELP